jgi:glutamyl-tRNA reductase
MRVLLVGLSHHTAPVELRERLAITKAMLPPALAELSRLDPLGEVVLLSTCNRTEIYAAGNDAGTAQQAIAEYLVRSSGFGDVKALEPYLYMRTDADAARHLFRVAAGLDSLVVGEPQIFGQVKDAFAAASSAGVTGPTLNKLFPASFVVGKRVRSETALGEGAVSVSYAAVSLARKIFGNLAGLNVLLVGAGEMSRLTAEHLKGHDVQCITVTSRTFEHARELAEEVRGAAVEWDRLDTALAASDIVVTATGSAEPVLTRARVKAAIGSRRSRPLFVIDIAVPRDVEASVGDLEHVFLYNIDDLEAIVADNLARREAEVARAEAIVAEELARFVAWLRARQAVPTVVALRQRFEAIRQHELRRLEPKLAQLSPEARGRVDEITRLIVEKLLLTPTEQLKALDDQQAVAAYTDALTRLFSLGQPGTSDAGAGPAPTEPADAPAGQPTSS